MEQLGPGSWVGTSEEEGLGTEPENFLGIRGVNKGSVTACINKHKTILDKEQNQNHDFKTKEITMNSI